jgi:exodeoxyribonuclease V alpha subunit
MSAATATEEIKGVVEILHCAKPGFSAGKLYCGARVVSFSVKGLVRQGQPVTLKGAWETHPKWGKQFKGSEVVHTMPADAEGIEAWLKVYATGMGPVKAKLAVQTYGVDFPRMLQTDPEQVAVELRLPIEFVNRTAAKWVANSGEVNAMSAMLRHGLTQAEAESLYERFKGGAVTILEDDPYSLLGTLAGFGWARVDLLGVKMGVAPDDPRRLQAAIVEVVRLELDNGSTCVAGEGLLNSAADLAGSMFVESGTLADQLDAAIRAERLVDLGGAYSLPHPAWVERCLWDMFERLRASNKQVRPLSALELESLRTMPVGDGSTVTLDDTQLRAVELASKTRGVVITGGAGCGKTLIAKAIVRMYLASDDMTIALCAPTGKAARRLTQVLGREATTIHRLLEYSGETGGFFYNAKQPLPHRLILVDEVSMCDAALLWHLLQAVGPGSSVVLVGDPNQLPPVGAGYPLRDILAHELLPAAVLERCHRQAGPLAFNSNAILDGVLEPTSAESEPPPWIKKDSLHEPGLTLAAIAFLFAGNDKHPSKLGAWGYGGLFDHQFMTAKHSGQLGTQAINELLQRLHQATLGVKLGVRDSSQERLPILVGDKVIQTVNNYQLGVMNGTLGVVIDDEPLMVEFEGKAVVIPKDTQGQVSLAYCLTPHKMQGSQVPCAIVVVPRQHSFMQSRNWLYTAVTRAQKTAIVMGDSTGCIRAVQTETVDTRVTVLQHLAKTREELQ